MEIQWYKSDKKSKKIKSYGFVVDKVQDLKPDSLPQEPEIQRRFKITIEGDQFLAYQKFGGKYKLIDNFKTEIDARNACLFVLRQKGAWR